MAEHTYPLMNGVTGFVPTSICLRTRAQPTCTVSHNTLPTLDAA
jgi:hypothetical protein